MNFIFSESENFFFYSRALGFQRITRIQTRGSCYDKITTSKFGKFDRLFRRRSFEFGLRINGAGKLIRFHTQYVLPPLLHLLHLHLHLLRLSLSPSQVLVWVHFDRTQHYSTCLFVWIAQTLTQFRTTIWLGDDIQDVLGHCLWFVLPSLRYPASRTQRLEESQWYVPYPHHELFGFSAFRLLGFSASRLSRFALRPSAFVLSSFRPFALFAFRLFAFRLFFSSGDFFLSTTDKFECCWRLQVHYTWDLLQK